MPKKIVQDVVAKRSIRNIPVTHHKETKKDEELAKEREMLIERILKKKGHSSKDKKPTVADEPEGYEPPKKVQKVEKVEKVTKKKTSKKSPKWWIFISLFVVILVGVFVVMMFFAGAEVTITPKHATVPVNSTLNAYPDATSTSAVLSYQVITVTQADSEAIPASAGGVSVDRKASGKIVIYNNLSSTPQTLVATTRFQTASGLIYRIPQTVQVPGLTTKDGKSTPGSLEVTVYADQPGSQYNIGMSDFTLPGFKDDPERSSKIFARSKTEMTGGSSKNDLGAAPADLQAAQSKMEARLKENLLREIRAQKPNDSVLYDAAITINYEMQPQTKKDNTTVLVNEKGTAHGVLLNKKLLSRAVLGDALASVGNEVEVRGIESLTFAPQTTAGNRPLWQQNPLSFTISGSVDVVGVVDKTKLLNDLRGLPRSNLQSILARYSTIDKANAIIRPFWKTSFPSDPNKITIKVSSINTAQ